MRRYLKTADPIVLNDGNMFPTVDYGMRTHGGFGLPGEPKVHREYIAGALLSGLALDFCLFSQQKSRS